MPERRHSRLAQITSPRPDLCGSAHRLLSLCAMLLFPYLNRAASSLPHAATYAERCGERASGFDDLLRTSHQNPGCEAVYNIVGHMTVVSSPVLIHTLPFGDEAQVPPAKARLQSKFRVLTKLKDWWPSVTTMTSKLFRLRQAYLYSVEKRTRKLDHWMIRFLLEHGSQWGKDERARAGHFST